MHIEDSADREPLGKACGGLAGGSVLGCLGGKQGPGRQGGKASRGAQQDQGGGLS